jgi:hypothetical protein
LIHRDEEWKQINELSVQAAEKAVGYQTQPGNRGWFDKECNISVHIIFQITKNEVILH